ncbi:MAG: hypothetical protein JJ974_00095 [Phycisphaerales bacterium]|nr:hypothetical protein [Phycisphaerales bacterium]
MKLNTHRYLLLAGLAAGLMSTTTLAQMASEPEKKDQAAEKAPESQESPIKAPQRVPMPKSNGSSSGNPNTASLPTNTPYPKLITKDENGKIVRLTELPDILALRSNPTVGDKSVRAIMPVLYGRRARFERIVIDNLDLFWMASDGRIETINLNDIQNMAQTAEMIKPLVGRTTLSAELLNRGILTRTQGGMNEHIVNEYKQAVTAEIQFEAEDPLSEVMRFVLLDSIHEPIQAYNAMIAETSTQIADLVEQTGLTSSAAMEVAKLQRPLNEDPEKQTAELEEFDAAFRKLDVEEGITILTAMRNNRKNPDISPAIKRINVMHDRKVDISNSKAMQGTITYADGRKIDTREAAAAYDKKLAEEEAKRKAQLEEENKNKDD